MNAVAEQAETVARSDNRSDVHPRIALLSPYCGGNFGDAAIQDSMIANLRICLPNAQFSGISLSNQNYLSRHGDDAFALCALNGSFWGMVEPETAANAAHLTPMRGGGNGGNRIRLLLHRVPGLTRAVRAAKSRSTLLKAELSHWRAACRFIRKHHLLIVCGGGQLDEEWGGAWGHPYALFKWTLLSRLAGVRCAMVSVGACKLRSRLSRFFLGQAVRLSSYRSYRDENSKRIAVSLSGKAEDDPVVPDLAFCLPEPELPNPLNLRSISGGRRIVAISPIVYGKPGVWPSPDPAVFARYKSEMTAVVAQLLDLDYFLVFVWSGSSDQGLIEEIIFGLGKECQARLDAQSHIARLSDWRDLVAVLRSADAMIGSRLHSTLLAFLATIPVVAISFDKKVDWAMQDMGQVGSLLHIRDFTASSVLAALQRVEHRRGEIVQELAELREKALAASSQQSHLLSQLISAALPS